ncbi:MAG TPA: FecR domain-containing protein [Chitinophagaceae bacterium]|nr:FecR domain-containing protein [Chitinophagaceae bacterium]
MNKYEIQELAEKIIAGTATEEEILLYNRVCNSYSETEEGWDVSLHGSKSELEREMKKEIWRQTISEGPVYRLRWHRWVAAASIIFIVFVLGTLLSETRPKRPQAVVAPPVKKVENDITPGHNGAILTLATGEQILLDSAGEGSLAQQGNVSVIKKNGELVYKNSGRNSELVYNTMSTPKARQFNLVLADGSRVWLNAASSITYPTAFSGKERKVTITGEAYFEVAHNNSMPFVVESGKNEVKVLGTHFNINAYDDENVVRVTLLEGSVDVRRGTHSRIIQPGQQAQINKDEQINLTRNVDVDHVVAWKNGRISFQGADIGTVMRQMSRWYDVDIEYNEKMNDRFYADISRSTMLSDVLKALELTTEVRFKIEGRKVSVLP